MRSTTPRIWIRLFLAGAVGCCVAGPARVLHAADAAASELTPAITAQDLDVERCAAFTGGQAFPPPARETLEALLGLRADVPATWKVSSNADSPRHFRLAFKQPVAIGTIVTTYAGLDAVFWFGAPVERTVSVLKPDAPYPGDVTNEVHWLALSSGRVKTLPPGTLTRAIRFTESYPTPIATPAVEYSTPASAMGITVLCRERYYAATDLGGEKEDWLGKVAASVTAFWGETQTIVGVVALSPRPLAASAKFLDPRSESHPTVAAPAEWLAAARTDVPTIPQVYRFEQPVRTRGIRVVPNSPVGSIAYSLGGPVIVLARLGADEAPPVFHIPPAPFSFALDMPMDGCVGLQILDKAGGQRVRRLLGEAERHKGAIKEPWDLRDDAGQYVAPGEYAWTALACPPLALTYQTTVNHAGRPPWWAPVRGGGAWMADESPPLCVGAVGDSVVLLGSAVCEKGNVAIAVNPEGEKLWGENVVLTGWGGAYRIASDGHYGYIVNHFGIQRVDPAQPGFAPTEIYRFAFDSAAPGGTWGGADLGGAAARGDRLYIAHRAPPAPWLASGPRTDDFDVKACWPPVVPRKQATEAEYDGMDCFYSTFLLKKPHDRVMSGFGAQGNASGAAQDLILAFRRPMVIGSVLVPDSGARVYALKPGHHVSEVQKGKPELRPEGLSTEVEESREGLWEPLRVQGAAGKDDAELDAMEAIVGNGLPAYDPTGKPGLALTLPGGIHTEALRVVAPRLEYCLIMSRRLRDVAPEAKRVCGEGEVTTTGGWQIARPRRPLITDDNPARMALVWDQPVTLRGVSFHRPTTASLRIDIWTGPSTNNPAAFLADDRFWEQKGSLDVEIDSYWARYASVRVADFGGEVRTRAVRVRAVLAAGVLGVQGFRSAVVGTQQAGFDSVIACSAAGEDAADAPVSLNERITEYKLPASATGTVALVRHIPIAKPGYLAFGKDGSLFAVSDGRVVVVPLSGGGEPREVIGRSLLERPAGMAVDADGLLYVVDQGPQVVKVFDTSKGTLMRTIGTPGGMRLGPWDPTRFDTPLDVAIDGRGKLWVVENSGQPKRVSRWTREGVLEKSFLGPANYGGTGFYGGGAWMDPGDRRIVNFDGMEFVIDWKDGSSRLANILYRAGTNSPTRSPTPNRAIYRDGRRYLVGDPRVYQEIGVICVESNGVAVPVAAAGNLGFWDNVSRYPGMREALADLCREQCGFVWTDLNGDGAPQPAEVQWTEKNRLTPTYCASAVGEDLSFNFAGVRLRPVGFTPGGAPRYDMAKLENVPLLGGQSTWTTADGHAFTIGNALLAPDGSRLWEIRDEHPGVNRSGAPRQAGVPVAQFEVIGHLTFGREELFVSNNNYGDWFVTSSDGLMPTWIFGGPPGYGLRHWTMPDWEYFRTRLDGLRLDSEDFAGSITKADDGHVYLIAGGQHSSVVRVDGFERMARLNGTFKVTAEDLTATRTWEAHAAVMRRATEIPKIAAVMLADRYTLTVDGALDEWVSVPFLPIREREEEGKGLVVVEAAALAFDNERLLVAARGTGPMLNGAADTRAMFQGGDAVDVCLGLDSHADPARTRPVAGDFRLLFTRGKGGQPVAVVYRPVPADAATAVRRERYFSPAGGEIMLDVISPIPGALVAIQAAKDSWSMEASIPWKSIGAAAPESGAKLRGDVGVLHGDQNSLRTVDRFYWAAKSQTCVSDEPTEARLTPALWGEISVKEDADAQGLLAPPGWNDAQNPLAEPSPTTQEPKGSWGHR